MKSLIVTAGGEISVADLEAPLYRSLNSLLGGFEIVNPRGLQRPYCMIVDDEGLLKEKDANVVGCILYETGKHGHPIVGDIAILRVEFGTTGADLAGLTDDDILKLRPKFETIVAAYKKYQQQTGGVS